MFSDDSSTWGPLALVGAISALVGLIFDRLTNYRKAVDAGEVEKIKAKQEVTEDRMKVIEEKAMAADGRATLAENKAALAAQQSLKCTEDRAELKGQLTAVKDAAEQQHAMLVEAIKMNADLQGQVNVVKQNVIRDTSETVQLAAKQGEMASEHGRIIERVAILENGGSKP